MDLWRLIGIHNELKLIRIGRATHNLINLATRLIYFTWSMPRPVAFYVSKFILIKSN